MKKTLVFILTLAGVSSAQITTAQRISDSLTAFGRTGTQSSNFKAVSISDTLAARAGSFGHLYADTATVDSVSFRAGTGTLESNIAYAYGNTYTCFGTSYCNRPGQPTWLDSIVPRLNVVAYDRAKGGANIGDSVIIGRIYATPPSPYAYYALDPAGNNVTALTPTADYAPVFAASVGWLATDTASKSFSSEATYSGTWGTGSIWGVGYRSATSPGDYAEFSCEGEYCIVGTLIDTAGGDISVFVDGDSVASWDADMSTVMPSSVTMAPAVFVIGPMSAGSHTIRLVLSGSGTRYLSWWQGASGDIVNGPRIFTHECIPFPQYDAQRDSLCATYTEAQDSILAIFRAAGYPVQSATVTLLSTDYQSDSIHVNGTGAAKIADSMATLFRSGTVQQALTMIETGNLANLSTPGYSWTNRVSAGGRDWNAVAFGDNQFVAVASNTDSTKNVMVSQDGIKWTLRTLPAPIRLRAVVFGDTQWVAVGDSGKVVISNDAATWTEHAIGSTRNFTSVHYGNGLYIAASVQGSVYSSADGVTWDSVVTPVSQQWTAGMYCGYLHIVTGASAGSGQTYITSPDGINWTERSGSNNPKRAMACGSGIMISVSSSGSGNRIDYSTLGASWPSLSGIPNLDFRAATYCGGNFIVLSAGSTASAMTSPDGINWTLRSVPNVDVWRGLTCADGVAVAVANLTGSTLNLVMTSGKKLSITPPKRR